jgi:hypothetical protein
MTGREAKSCRGLFEKLDILSVPLQYILSLMLYAIIRIILHGFGCTQTKYKKQKSTSHTDFTSFYFSEGCYFLGIRIFNRLSCNIQHLRNERVCFRNKLWKYLVINLFYSITEFLEHSTN